MSPTVQGICTDCWGSKGGRQFWLPKAGSAPESPVLNRLSPYLIGAAVVAVPAILLGLWLWIWG
jgi:hypothetical protein